jgi:hypothetical protein
MEGAEKYCGAMWEAFEKYNKAMQRMLSKCLNENIFTMVISKLITFPLI